MIATPERVFPACAGMNRLPDIDQSVRGCVPRMRGDEPVQYPPGRGISSSAGAIALQGIGPINCGQVIVLSPLGGQMTAE